MVEKNEKEKKESFAKEWTIDGGDFSHSSKQNFNLKNLTRFHTFNVVFFQELVEESGNNWSPGSADREDLYLAWTDIVMRSRLRHLEDIGNMFRCAM